MRSIATATAAALLLLSTAVSADEEEPLDRDGVVELVSGKTALCRKEKDQSLCTNYFSDEGVIKQVMDADGERKEGVWFVDDQDRLCILWTGRIKPLCFGVYPQADGSYNMIKKEKHITTILGVEDGNTKNL